MPFNPKFTITPKINKAIVEIECVRGFLDAVKLNTQPAPKLESLMPAVLAKALGGKS